MPFPCRVTDRADLSARNTFGVRAIARRLLEVDSVASLPAVLDALPAHEAPLVLGGGSNLLFAGDPPGDVMAIVDASIELLGDHGAMTHVRAAAGAGWHDVVLHTLAHGLGGLENLALIPGTAGAAPIQNIGAYGVEVGDRIVAVDAIDRMHGNAVRLEAAACRFGYRDSVFKQTPDRYLVTAVEFALSRDAAPVLDYAGLRDALLARGLAEPTPRDAAEAVIAIRRRKLPDPAVIGNAGSFFKNPIVPVAVADALRADAPTLPVFDAGPGLCKLSAAWLIDQCGWKGHRDGDAGVSAGHALVLVNHGRASGADLLALARRIAASVHERFGIALEPEPRIVGATW